MYSQSFRSIDCILQFRNSTSDTPFSSAESTHRFWDFLTDIRPFTMPSHTLLGIRMSSIRKIWPAYRNFQSFINMKTAGSSNIWYNLWFCMIRRWSSSYYSPQESPLEGIDQLKFVLGLFHIHIFQTPHRLFCLS